MLRFFPSKTNENSDYKRSYSRNKSSSHVVPSPTPILPEKTDNNYIVRIRLVFIHIGKIKIK